MGYLSARRLDVVKDGVSHTAHARFNSAGKVISTMCDAKNITIKQFNSIGMYAVNTRQLRAFQPLLT